MDGGVTPASEAAVPGPIGSDYDYQVFMDGTWEPGTSVSVDLFLKDSSENEIAGSSDTVRLLGPVVMPIGNSMTFGYRRTMSPWVAETPNWAYYWTSYPTDWSGVSGTKADLAYQGWRGYLRSELEGFAWEGEDPNGHGPNHMGYSGAVTTHINALLSDASRSYPIDAFETDPCYAIVVYFVGVNDINDNASGVDTYSRWQTGLNTILGYRAGRGKTLVVGVTTPKLREGSPYWTAERETQLLALNASIRTHPVSADNTKYICADAEGIPHDANDDGLHFLATGYESVKDTVLEAIVNGLK